MLASISLQGETALMCASERGHLKLAKMLLGAGADVNASTSGPEVSLQQWHSLVFTAAHALSRKANNRYQYVSSPTAYDAASTHCTITQVWDKVHLPSCGILPGPSALSLGGASNCCLFVTRGVSCVL